ncbi:MAG TPA: DDE transposase family protein [Synechococcus sp. M44_DOE_062]|nr:DDE transposase family protein [Synechococcus sp. M44_DOE_062]
MVSAPVSGWYVIKQVQGSCQVLCLAAGDPLLSQQEHWGPFPSQAEAIARRVGLIRAGKCQPV